MGWRDYKAWWDKYELSSLKDGQTCPEALLKEIGRVYVPVMLANAKAVRDKAEKVEAVVEGQAWVQNPFPYQAKCVLWLREEFSALSPADQAAVRAWLGAAHGEGLLPPA